MKFVNKYENYKQREGTINEEISLCKKDEAQEVDIYKCLEKYGMGQLINQTMAMQPIYIDNTNMPKTLQESVQMQKDFDEYFKNLPARVRKVFDDNKDVFYQKYMRGDYTDYLTTGVMTQDMVNSLKIDKEDFLNNEQNVSEVAKRTDINDTNTTDSLKDNTGPV